MNIGITNKHKGTLAKVSRAAADAATKISEGKKLHVTLFKKVRSRKNSYDYLEDKERRRRMHQRPSNEEFAKLRQISLQASELALHMQPEKVHFAKEGKSLYNQDVVVQRKYFHDLEETERQLRTSFPPSKEQLQQRKQLVHSMIRKATKFGKEEAEFFDSNYLDTLEDKERKRRITEKPSLSQLSLLRNIAVVAAQVAKNKFGGRLIHLYKIKGTSIVPPSLLSEITEQEEMERVDRVKNPPSGKQRFQLKVLSHEVANVASSRLIGKKRKPFGYIKPSSIRKEVTRTMEEQERKRRISHKPTPDQLHWLRILAHLAAERGAKSTPSLVVKAKALPKLPITTQKPIPQSPVQMQQEQELVKYGSSDKPPKAFKRIRRYLSKIRHPKEAPL
jgi:hypothetical protein